MQARTPVTTIVKLTPLMGPLLFAVACSVHRPTADTIEVAAPSEVAAAPVVAAVAPAAARLAAAGPAGALRVLQDAQEVRTAQGMPPAVSPVVFTAVPPARQPPPPFRLPAAAAAMPTLVLQDPASPVPLGLAVIVLISALAFIAFWRWAGRERTPPPVQARAVIRRDPVLALRRQPAATQVSTAQLAPLPAAAQEPEATAPHAYATHGAHYQLRWHLQGIEAKTWAEWFDRAGVDMGKGILPELAAAVPVAGGGVPPAPPADVSWSGLQAILDRLLGEGVCRMKPGYASCAPDLYALQEPLPAPVVERLWTAMGDIPDNAMTRWLWVNIVRLACFRLAGVDPAHVEEEAIALTFPDVAAGGDHEPTIADWEALRLRLRLTAVVRLGGAARHLGFARLRAAYEALSQRHTAIVRRAWIDVLLAWGALQQGGAALQRFVEAEALCQQLIEEGVAHTASNCLLVRVLLGRADSESGGLRSATLQRAAGVANAVFCESAAPEAALAVAQAAMARSGCAAEDAISPLLEQALQHAFIAARDPDHVVAALQIRLAAQLSHEALPGAGVQSNVADALCRQLERMPGLSAQAWRHIVQLHLRQGRYIQACLAGARAAECGHAHRELLQLWERASSEWRNTRPHADEHRQWQENARARQAVAASL